VDILALVTPPHPDQVARETALIAAAEAVGVKRIVNWSTLGADLPKPVTSFARWQQEIETALARSSVPAVTVRPNFFMQNILAQLSEIRSGVFAQPWGAFAMSVIDVSDAAEVAASVADGSHDGTAIDLTGPEALTGEKMASLLARRPDIPWHSSRRILPTFEPR
jgi:NAD(P)H dehydrogenase (quinone)